MKIPVTSVIAALAFGCTTARHGGDHGVTDRGAEHATPISVVIAGDVYQPERYSLPAGTRLSEAISRAGGFTDLAFKRGVLVTGTDGRMFRYDLRQVTSGSAADPILHDGDIVAVHRWLRPGL
jgi:hypothetical protein